jgi:hypothetical protein
MTHTRTRTHTYTQSYHPAIKKTKGTHVCVGSSYATSPMKLQNVPHTQYTYRCTRSQRTISIVQTSFCEKTRINAT